MVKETENLLEDFLFQWRIICQMTTNIGIPTLLASKGRGPPDITLSFIGGAGTGDIAGQLIVSFLHAAQLARV